jgi:hypothetical protein
LKWKPAKFKMDTCKMQVMHRLMWSLYSSKVYMQITKRISVFAENFSVFAESVSVFAESVSVFAEIVSVFAENDSVFAGNDSVLC